MTDTLTTRRITTGTYEIKASGRIFEAAKSATEGYWNLYELSLDPVDGEEMSREWWESFATLRDAKAAVTRNV